MLAMPVAPSDESPLPSVLPKLTTILPSSVGVVLELFGIGPFLTFSLRQQEVSDLGDTLQHLNTTMLLAEIKAEVSLQEDSDTKCWQGQTC